MLHLNYLRTWDIFEPPLQMKDNKWAEVWTLYQQLYLKNCPFLHCISRYKHRCVLAPCMLFWHLIGQTSSCSNMRHKFHYTHNKQIKFCFTRHYRPAQLGTDNYIIAMIWSQFYNDQPLLTLGTNRDHRSVGQCHGG